MVWPSSSLAGRTDDNIPPNRQHASVFPAPTPKYSSTYAQASAEGYTRPSTATSYTTSSSYRAWGRAPDSEWEQRSPSLAPTQEPVYLRSPTSVSGIQQSFPSRHYRNFSATSTPRAIGRTPPFTSSTQQFSPPRLNRHYNSPSSQESFYPQPSSSISNTQSPPRVDRSYMSPPGSQDPAFASSSSQQQIPSAQPRTPILEPSPHGFSLSDFDTPPLPSPPNSQPDHGNDEILLSPFEWFERPEAARSAKRDVAHSTHVSQLNSVKPLSSQIVQSESTNKPTTPPRRRPGTEASIQNDPDVSDMLDAVLDGIGRIHVTMGLDDAGRWRIKRPNTGEEQGYLP